MPTADRPSLPSSYGIQPLSQGRVVPWEAIEAKLQAARNYWVATCSPECVPHAAPVWGLWHKGHFYFGADPQSRKGRNLAANPRSIVHLESGDDVVIAEGAVTKLRPKQVTPELDAAYSKKYGFPLKGTDVYRLVPKRVFAWSEADFPQSATRWWL
jgi:hypothetical protein